jgi:hypothetical protein
VVLPRSQPSWGLPAFSPHSGDSPCSHSFSLLLTEGGPEHQLPGSGNVESLVWGVGWGQGQA